jgi:cytochrome c-type biogenesis protein
MKVELFFTPGCKKCEAAREGLKAAAHEASPNLVWREINAQEELDYAVELSVPFSVAICPVCTPALIVLLGVTASIGSPLQGAVILLAFALGRAIPIALGAWAIGWLESIKPLARYQHVFDMVGGIALVLAGLYMLNAVYFFIPELAG